MKKINVKKLLNMYISVTVKEAIEKGELDLFNVSEWAQKRNGGMRDLQYENEVYALVRYYCHH